MSYLEKEKENRTYCVLDLFFTGDHRKTASEVSNNANGPHSYADAEQVFSMVGPNETKVRIITVNVAGLGPCVQWESCPAFIATSRPHASTTWHTEHNDLHSVAVFVLISVF